MSTPDPRRLTVAVLLCAGAAFGADPATPQLGVALDRATLAALPRSIHADGRGLPPGRGTVADGQRLYAARCQSCHGENGRGGSGGHLIGDGPLTGPDADPAVNTYWPYAAPLWDWIHRAMPMDAPGSLSVDETYAVTAFLLHRGGLLAADETLDERRLPAIRMPNRDGFDAVDAPRR